MDERPGAAAGAAETQFDVLIVGGGPAGTASAARLRDLRPELTIAIVDPEPEHDYRPGWTLVGAGVLPERSTRRPRKTCIPGGVLWLRDRAIAFDPGRRQVVLESGSCVSYRTLVVAAGVETRWNAVEGLEDALERGIACSIYRRDLAGQTWQQIRDFRGGRALFTRPPYPVQCAGSSQSILYLAADHWRRHGIHADLEFLGSGVGLHSVPYYANALRGVASHYAVDARFTHQLVAINADRREAVLIADDGDRSERLVKDFDFLHVTPPQRPPAVLRTSPLANALGWLDVNIHTLQHNRHPEVFGIGDCAALPTSKTVAAIRAQVPVLVENLLSARYGTTLNARYDGYSACPIATSGGKVMLAEFGYNSLAMPSFRGDARVPKRIFWLMKRWYFPHLYWGMLDGRLGVDWHRPLRDRGQHLPSFQP